MVVVPTFGNGTSFSCPIVSGLAACLWQSNSAVDNMAIFEAIRSNASQFYTPDNKRGFGIANFKDASWSVSEMEYATSRPVEIDVYPNPLGNSFFLKVSGSKQKVRWRLLSTTCRVNLCIALK
ncbi:MAG: S8 family serine peptidase [Owenweeksia sp.]|nr:S8 family serine peptidase [Owenweeksia sp.]